VPFGRAANAARDAFGTKSAQTRAPFRSTVDRVARNAKTTKVATPWGRAVLVDELALRQRAGEARFQSLVQLLESPTGERLVLFAYSSGGSARRGPVTLRARDLERLRAALADHAELAAALGAGGGAA
jgi:hypothetical protein